MIVRGRQIGLALAITLALLAAGRSVAVAGPAQLGEPPRLSLGSAAIIGVLYYLSVSPWLANLGFTALYRPLVAGTLVGLVMGRLGEGVAIGANINVLYLGWIGAGGTLPGDPGLAGYLGTALALSAGLDAESALALAAPLGLLGGLTFSLRMSLCSVIPHWADAFAERGDTEGVARCNYVYSQPLVFVLYAVPVAAAAYLGADVVGAALSWLGESAAFVMSGLFTASSMLAALGIALNLRFLLRGSVWPYFFVGYVIASMAGGEINLLALAAVGVCVGYLHVLFSKHGPDTPTARAVVEPARGPGLLTRRDVFGAWVRWLFFSHSSWNWERMQGVGFAHSMASVISKLYRTKEERRAALKRHLVFFNSQPDLGGVIHGVVIAMEEQRASGADISEEAINSAKTGLMGPMAGIGDTVQQGIVLPIALSIGMSIATGGIIEPVARGSALGPILFLLMMAAFAWGVGWLVWWQGYCQGRAAVVNILGSDTLSRVISGSGVLGNLIMGALTVQFVAISTPVGFAIGGSVFQLQPILDSLMPNILPLLLVLIVWWLLAKRQISPTWILAGILLLGMISSYPVWPGIAPDGGGSIRVGFFR